MTIGEEKATVEDSHVNAASGVSLGKGAWDCDTRTAIPPEKEVAKSPCDT